MNVNEIVEKFNIDNPELVEFIDAGVKFKDYLNSEISRLSNLVGLNQFIEFDNKSVDELVELKSILEKEWDRKLPPMGRGIIDFNSSPGSLFSEDEKKMISGFGMTEDEYIKYYKLDQE